MSVQPSLSKWTPIALMVGVLAGGTVYLSGQVGPMWAPAGAVWVPFISWALYFIAGGKVSRLHKYVLALVGGILYGWITIVIGNWLNGAVGAAYGYAITVFAVATSIVLLELTDWFELAPAYFFGYAGYFAYVFGHYPGSVAGQEDSFWITIPYIILTLFGLFLGWLTVTLKGIMLDKMGVPMDQRNTVFDKEAA